MQIISKTPFFDAPEQLELDFGDRLHIEEASKPVNQSAVDLTADALTWLQDGDYNQVLILLGTESDQFWTTAFSTDAFASQSMFGAIEQLKIRMHMALEYGE